MLVCLLGWVHTGAMREAGLFFFFKACTLPVRALLPRADCSSACAACACAGLWLCGHSNRKALHTTPSITGGCVLFFCLHPLPSYLKSCLRQRRLCGVCVHSASCCCNACCVTCALSSLHFTDFVTVQFSGGAGNTWVRQQQQARLGACTGSSWLSVVLCCVALTK